MKKIIFTVLAVCLLATSAFATKPSEPITEMITSVVVTLTNPLDVGQEELKCNITGSSGGFTSLTSANHDVITLSNGRTLENYNKVLKTFTYHNTAIEPNQTPRIITFVAHAGDTQSNIGKVIINIIMPIVSIVMDLDTTDAGYDYTIQFIAGSEPVLIALKGEIRINE
jgi:hypothetical protein